MLTLETKYHQDEIFDSYLASTRDVFLWEILQGWIVFLSQRDKSPDEISQRLYFFELLSNHLQIAQEEFDLIRQQKVERQSDTSSQLQ
ncbi:hypothetical protein [Algoriphagus sp. A40]|uniref:hypothetical protein n=1 Tax=Algoriphagus sp. A40 TaxID=1945863 RepID=UPI0009CB7BD9|nr:hypothetical protein [Algoriphagus sp. A40]OOG72734.1 hypothetical protein B0E43_14830 [Algoriphagus sp. A40]